MTYNSAMDKNAYRRGALAALMKHAGLFETPLVPRLIPAAIGSLLGAAAGYPMGTAFTQAPEGPLFGLLPPTQGQVDYTLQSARGTGAVIGALAGAGLGALGPEILQLLKYRQGTIGDKLGVL